VRVELQFDDGNVGHMRRHGLTPSTVAEVALGKSRLVPNEPRPARAGTHKLIGRARDGRFWTIVLVRLGEDFWRPITGWPSTRTEIRLYEETD
jgi:uncharacterized DUF497 family protein